MITAIAQRLGGGSEDYSTPLISPETSPALSGAAVSMWDPCLSQDQDAMHSRALKHAWEMGIWIARRNCALSLR
jgi:hypothetical protein